MLHILDKYLHNKNAIVAMLLAFLASLLITTHQATGQTLNCQSAAQKPDQETWPPNWHSVDLDALEFSQASPSQLQPADLEQLLGEMAQAFKTNQQQSIESMTLCGGFYSRPVLYQPEDSEALGESKKIRGWADSYQYDNTGIASLCGDVILLKENLQIKSDHVRIDQSTETADLSGQVLISTPETLLQGRHAKVYFATNRTELSEAKFFFFPQNARGSAKKIVSEGTSDTYIESGQYTTCPPGNNDWSIEGEHIALNHEDGWGSLKHMRLKLGRVPIFYTPYFKFPLDDKRHTGFLFPSINSLTEPDLAIPFYWNIAPNYDLLLNPRYIGGRGTLYEGSFRYLHRPGTGQIQIGFLPGDDQFDNQDRKQAVWAHQGAFGSNWQWSSDVAYLSDNEYLNDLGADLGTVGQSFLNRRLSLQGTAGAWSSLIEVQAYQTIDAAIAPNDQPYRKLPQINLDHTRSFLNYLLEMHNHWQYTYWAQPEANSTPYAHRSHWQTQLSLPLRDSWYFFTPTAHLQSTYYQLMGNDSLTTDEQSIKRFVPTFSLDSGLFFDRSLRVDDENWLQSLEPRLFHTYTPYRSQDLIPVFDTTSLTFGFDQLFRPNRFSGIDRIGDTHQTTLAVTTRLMDTQRQERASLTLGQILYHKDRTVSLPDVESLTSTRSAAVLHAMLAPQENINITGGLTWDSQQNLLEDGNLSLINTSHPNFTWQTQYRYRRANTTLERLEQVNFAFRKHVTGAWHFINGIHYDVENEQLLEQFTGLQYEDCCWRTDLVYHRRIRSSTSALDISENDYSFLLQFELKGLGGIGSRLNTLLSTHIPGYNP